MAIAFDLGFDLSLDVDLNLNVDVTLDLDGHRLSVRRLDEKQPKPAGGQYR